MMSPSAPCATSAPAMQLGAEQGVLVEELHAVFAAGHVRDVAEHQGHPGVHVGQVECA